jgi:hypothetical protein
MIASSKIGTLLDAVAQFVRPGQSVALEGFTRWMADHVMATLDHAAFLRSIEGG